MALKTDYKEDVLDTSVNTRRKYNMINNSDGTVSFADATEYTQVGDTFGAADINNTNSRIEEVFQLGSNVKAELVTALQYSGLGITAESTWEEVYEALESAFPECVYVFKDGVLLENVSLTEIEVVDNVLYKRIGASNDESVHTTCKLANIDFTKYNKLEFTVTARGHSDYGSSEIKYGIDGVDTNFTYSNGEIFTKTVTVDISSEEGRHELHFYLKCKCSSSNTSWGASAYISISEVKLIV